MMVGRWEEVAMHSYSFSKEFINRFSEFVSSAEYQKYPDYAKSDYWEYHSRSISVEISGNTITVGGKSGYYIPPSKNLTYNIKKVIRRVIRLYRNPSKLIRFFAEKLHRQGKGFHVQLLNYFDAFDAIMNHDPITDIDLAPYRINFESLRMKDGVISSVKEMKQVYFAKDKYQLNSQMVYAYYISNIINGYVGKQLNTILEIGAGNGNLASLLYYLRKPTIIIVDLPETLCLSIPFIADLFPDAKILMPHESHLYSSGYYDFIFLTPDQIDVIDDNSVDLSICMSNFQEMTHRQIKEYFDLIQRSSHDGAYFLCCNRVEKIPASFAGKKETDVPVSRFSDYPWNPNNDIVIYEICKLIRLVQLDNTFIRLERIIKNGHEK